MTRYDGQLMHDVCSGPRESACAKRALELVGRGARKRVRSTSDDADAVAWVGCDGACGRWFHTVCVQIAPSAADEWLCEECIAAQPDEDTDVLVE